MDEAIAIAGVVALASTESGQPFELDPMKVFWLAIVFILSTFFALKWSADAERQSKQEDHDGAPKEE